VRQINLENYTVRVRNEQGVVRFKEEKCSQCGSNLVVAEPVKPKVQSPNILTGECPKCGQAQVLVVPDFLEPEYDVRDSLIEVMFSRDLQLSARELLDRDDLARKIRDCSDGFVLLEEEEWKKLEKAVNTIKGFGKPDVEFVHRILEAEEVKVEEKKPTEG